MVCFVCCDVSEEYTAFFFRVTKLVHVNAEVITSGAQLMELLIVQFCPVPCYFLLFMPSVVKEKLAYVEDPEVVVNCRL
jgi:hypothetical protein